MHLIFMIDTPSERHAVCIPYIIDKIYEIERASKKPGFGTLQGGVRYPMHMSPDPQAVSSGKKKDKVSIGAMRARRVVTRPSKPDRSSNMQSHAGGDGNHDDEDGTTPFSEREEVYDSKLNDDGDEEASRDDFLCVPASNIDHDQESPR
jgi:hypothetical protein